MTRKKVKLAYITNDSARKATFKKRKKGLMKKVNELSTLCGIEACAIIYSPYESQPEVWPSPLEARQVATKFKGLPEMEQSKKMVNQESYLRQRIMKASEQLKKQRKDNREKDITHVMFQSVTGKSFHNLDMADFNDLEWVIGQYLKEIDQRMDSFKKLSTQKHSNQGQLAVTSTRNVGTSHAGNCQIVHDPHHQETERTGSGQISLDAMQRQPNWFMDLMNVNPQESNVGFCGVLGDEMLLPFGDNTNHINGSWSTAFFP